MQDSLSALLTLSDQQKQARGLIDTPREIHQQPRTWRETFHRLSAMHPQILAFLRGTGSQPGSANPPDVILTGAGTSDYIGRSLKNLLHRQWRCEVAAIASTALLTNMEEILLPGKQYLMISFSRSGESSEGVAVLQQAVEQYPDQVRHLVITCNASSTMASLPGVSCIKLDDAVNDRGLAMTSSFSNMVVAGQYLAHIQAPAAYASIVESLAEAGAHLLPQASDTAARLAGQGFRRACFLGTGSLQAVAQECALKVLELNAGHIPTLAESFLGLRHGPMSFLNPETLVVAFLSGSQHRRQYELDLLEETRRKNISGGILILTPHPETRIAGITEHVLTLKLSADFPDACRPPLDVIAGQLLALFFAIENGITPDTPSTGAISRVVSHVRIYPPAARTQAQ